jgi:hypothetical protein
LWFGVGSGVEDLIQGDGLDSHGLLLHEAKEELAAAL